MKKPMIEIWEDEAFPGDWTACYDDENDHRYGHGSNAMEALADLLGQTEPSNATTET